MENNDSNIKPQSTGGLKLMTVFVVVLALHVVVIGGMTTYYLLKGGSADTDLLTDKAHKDGLKVNPDGSVSSDGQLPDAADKSATASTTPTTDTSATPAPEPAASADTSSTPSAASAQMPAPAPGTPTTPAPSPITVATTTTTTQSPLAPPTDPSQPGSVINMAATPAPTPATPDAAQSAPTTDGAPYVVKAHDSLAKSPMRTTSAWPN